MNYDELLQECHENGASVIEKNLKSEAKGLLKGNKIVIRKNLSTYKEKKCILVEELGHLKLTAGNILDCSNDNNMKQEHKARMYSYDKLVGLGGILSSYEAGKTTIYDMADFLNVTEEFLTEALESYRKKYGTHVICGNYTIYFVPCLGVVKML